MAGETEYYLVTKHLIKYCENNGLNTESWDEVNSLLFSCLSAVKIQESALEASYYDSITDNPCLTVLFDVNTVE